MRSGWLILLSCLVLTAYSQNSRWLSASYMPGFLLAHRADIKNLSAHNYGLELTYEIDQSNTNWGSHYRKPIIGFSVLYYNLGMPITGHAIGGLAKVKLGLIEKERFALFFSMAGGLAYLSETFDLEKNKRNQAIGSHTNGSMQFGLLGHSDIKYDQHFIEYGISISHYSNAAYKVPNLGYNIPSITLKYGFGLKPSEERRADNNAVKNKVLDWRATLFYGKKQVNLANPKDFTHYGVQLRGIRHANDVRAWRFGLDYTLDKTYAFAENNQADLGNISVLDQTEVAAAAGYQWTFGSVDVVTELGSYLYQPNRLKARISQRIGIIYNPIEAISLQGTLRFHEGVADFFEIGLGYTL